MMKHVITLIFTTFIFLGLPLSKAFAQEQRHYLIEVVLFENVTSLPRTSEELYWPSIDDSVLLGSETAVAAGFLTREEGLTLIDNAAAIAASNRYRLLRHLAWRQPGLDDAQAIAVRVALGESIPMYVAGLESSDAFIPGSSLPTTEFQRSIQTSVLNGTLRVRLGRFLHLDARLVFTDPTTLQSYRIEQSRKMRSRELHYIDNPRFGLLTRITPIESDA